MASQYSLADYDSDEERAKYPQVPEDNLASAALFCVNMLESKNINYALFGGFAIRLLGGKRDTRNVDILFQGNIKDIWSIVETQHRLVIPSSRLTTDILKVLVHTGPGYDSCDVQVPVAVTLIESGINQPSIRYRGSPKSLATNRLLSSVDTIAGHRPIYVLGVFDIINVKLAAFMHDRLDKDKEDLLFLMRKYPEKVCTRIKDLDQEAATIFMDSIPDDVRPELTEEIFNFKIHGVTPMAHREYFGSP
ncbi:hypothetical protein CPC735_064130 [Coccidioides posadasii C735 delta SOWgp]|uniref:Uncharacterized protein n=1 Tax=Coccidioides posadasii (strain C735) TaxID=222929 RepID=C5P4C2_COCP7|nr:hypothetical protein CPC735_064130 [Coccidioides posadasii C735 delta SOWgp]EER28540.1 hypothetical protein CPC735_064130 [Coccidioides posadasii C735 delta SOWgp]|eukprot:XP_003070685.1 hypothetical protein CPC735_064130 [Coccidioides posadasii C735 delta SOWgp]